MPAVVRTLAERELNRAILARQLLLGRVATRRFRDEAGKS